MMDSPTGLGEVVVKSEDDLSLDCGCTPAERSMKEYLTKGIVIVDKVSGPTSHQVTVWVRQIVGFKKAGHSGTLDPKVTGLLPVALGSATKVVGALLSSPKRYVGIMRVHGEVSKKQLNSLFNELTGEIYQKPPLKSAVKRELRKRTIYSLDLIERDGRYVVFDVSCQAGTYIRKLIHDGGLILGCGANMQELRRTKVALFNEDDCVILQDLKDAFVDYTENGVEAGLREIVHPMEEMVAHLKKIWVKNSAVGAIACGAKLMAPGVTKLHDSIKAGEGIAIMTGKGELLALAKALNSSDEILNLNRGVIAKPSRVIIEADVYPRIWGDNK